MTACRYCLGSGEELSRGRRRALLMERGHEFKRLRELAGLTLVQLADRTLSSPSYLCDVEQGLRLGNAKIAEAYAALRGKS